MKINIPTMIRTILSIGLAGFAGATTAGAALATGGALADGPRGASAGTGVGSGGTTISNAAPQLLQNCMSSPTGEPHFVQNLAISPPWSS
jgi:hypothetical protein